MPNPQVVSDFSGGKNEIDATHVIKDNEVVDAMDMFGEPGKLYKRPGILKYNLVGLSTYPFTSGCRFNKADGTSTIVVTGGTKIFKDTGTTSTFSEIQDTAMTSGKEFTFANVTKPASTVDPLLLLANGVEAIRKWTGTGNTAILGGTPPLGSLVTWHKYFAFIAGVSAAPQRLNYSAQDNVESYPGNYIDIPFKDKGDAINWLLPFADELLIAGSRQIWSLVGDSPLNWYPREYYFAPGVVRGRTMVGTPYGVFYLSWDGVYHLVGEKPAKISDKVRKSLAGIDNTTACGGYHNGKYFLAYRLKTDVNTYPWRCLCYDILHQAWWPLNGFTASQFIPAESEDDEGRMFFASSKTSGGGFLYSYPYGEADTVIAQALATFEADESWLGGVADTAHFADGLQGRRTLIESCDDASSWVSADPTNFTVSQETSDKQQGTGAVKVVAKKSTVSICDYFGEWNYRSSFSIDASGSTACGESFTGDGRKLGSVKFYLMKHGAPTGNAVAKVYAHAGTWGSSGIPTGAPLATSDPFDVSTLTTSAALISFAFTGANQITLVSGVHYFVIFEYSGGDVDNLIWVGADYYATNFAGNACEYYSSSWHSTNWDVIFYVYTFTDIANYHIDRDFGAGATKDLTGINTLKWWIKTSATVNMRFGMGEAAATEQTKDFTTAVNTWETISWDISAIAAGSKDAIRYLRLSLMSEITGDVTIYIDGICTDMILSNLTLDLSALADGDTFDFYVYNPDSRTKTVKLIMETSAGNYYTGSTTVPVGVSTGSITKSSFVNTGAPNWNSITKIRLLSTDSDVTFDNLRVIPASGTTPILCWSQLKDFLQSSKLKSFSIVSVDAAPVDEQLQVQVDFDKSRSYLSKTKSISGVKTAQTITRAARVGKCIGLKLSNVNGNVPFEINEIVIPYVEGRAFSG